MPQDPVDRPGEVRSGEELDRQALRAWLAEVRPDFVSDGQLEVQQFGSGYSNLTYLIRSGEREAVLRRPPFGSKVSTAHDMSREYRVLEKLHPAWGKVPEPLAFCDDEDVLGAPFYLMERVSGIILRRDPPPEMDWSRELARRLSEATVDTLAELHGLDLQATGLGGLGKPQGYAERQLVGWTQRYYASQTDDIPEVEEVATWLADHLPAVVGDTEPAFVHNDFKYDNLVLDPADPATVRAVLDWEMATVGDPGLDLGTTLGYWVEAGDPEPLRRFRFGPTDRPGSLTRRQLVERYGRATGRELSHPAFYYAFGLFKIAVIAQQIYYRWVHGHTQDERFAALLPAIRVLGRTATAAAEYGSI